MLYVTSLVVLLRQTAPEPAPAVRPLIATEPETESVLHGVVDAIPMLPLAATPKNSVPEEVATEKIVPAVSSVLRAKVVEPIELLTVNTLSALVVELRVKRPSGVVVPIPRR